MAMANSDGKQLRLLVCIASHGTSNDQYLHQLLRTYRALPYSTDIVVLSNIPRIIDNVQVIAGLPTSDPWSLPFGHKQLFADRVNDYDLFIYSENDTLITQRNIEAFLRVTRLLPDNEIAGFLRYEEDRNGNRHYPDVHRTFHWDVESLRTRHGQCFAHFTNEHAAAYILTRHHLLTALASGGFLVGPHSGKYDLLVSAATDPYTQCGLKKVLCLSQFDDFLIHHLPNKYVDSRLSLDGQQFLPQLERLRQLAEQRLTPAPLLREHPEFLATDVGPDYYDRPQEELITAIPADAESVLSIGCGWGATEERIAALGKAVTAIPLDTIIAACARTRGIEVIDSDLKSASQALAGRTFDCILIRNVLHLFERPGEVLAIAATLLGRNGCLIVSVPNLIRLPILMRRMRRYDAYKGLGNFQRSGVHLSSRSSLRRWLNEAGMRVVHDGAILPERATRLHPWLLRVTRPFLAREVVTLAVRTLDAAPMKNSCIDRWDHRSEPAAASSVRAQQSIVSRNNPLA
jgi:2-polyprenyl-3-methyl-5-hydroxy-6-metoxy-1,4-benzoquinol methylase